MQTVELVCRVDGVRHHRRSSASISELLLGLFLWAHCTDLRPSLCHCSTVGGPSPDLWRRRCASIRVLAAVQRDKFLELVLTDAMLGQQICWVALTSNLTQIDSPRSHSLLYPERVRVEVSQFAQTLAAADPDRRAGVGPDADGELDAEVSE